MTKQTDTYKHTPAGEYYREGPHGQGENGTPSDENQPSKPSRRQSFKEVYDKLKKEGEIDIEAFVEKANTLDLNPVQTKKDERWMNAEVKWTADRVKEEIRLIEKNQESHPRKKRKKTFKAVYNKFKKKGEFDIKVLVEEANRLDLNPVKTEKDERWVNAEAKWTVDRVREEIRLIEKENAENEENTSSNETASSKPERYTFKPIKMTVTTDRDNKDLRVAPQNLTAPSKKVPSASRPAPVAPASGGNPPPNDNNNNDLPMDSSTQPTKPVNGLKTSGTKKTSYIYVISR